MNRISFPTLIALLILLPWSSLGLNQRRIDSLSGALSRATVDTVKFTILRELFHEYVRNNIDKAYFYNEQALRLAKRIKYKKGIAEAILNRSSIFRIKGKYDSALAIMIEAKPIIREFPDQTFYADYLGDIGNLYTVKNDPKNALTYLMESLEIYKKTGSTRNLALLYNRFGTLYNAQKQFDSALVYHKKSLEINEACGFKLGCSANLINIGIIYEDKGDHLTAIDYTLKALEIKKDLGDKQGIGKCLNNIGASYMNLGNVSSAIDYHEKALLLARECNSTIDIGMSYINLDFDYQKGGNFNKAVYYALKGFHVAKQVNDFKLLRESTRVLYESYAGMSNFKEAYNFHLIFKQFSDSIVNEKNLKALQEIQAKYNVATREKEITELKIAKEKQNLEIQTMRAWYNLAIGLFIALLVLVFFFYYRSRISRKLSLKLKEINDMKSHFFANLSHEFRTPLTLMLGPAEKLMQTAKPEDKPWLELIHRNASRLLFLDEQLLEFTRIDSGNQKIHLVSGNILLPLRAIAESYQLHAEQKNIHYTVNFPPEPVETHFDADILEKVTGNLLSNAFKYTPSGGRIEFVVTTTNQPGPAIMNSFLKIEVKDNGIGIPDNKKEMIFERFYQLNHDPGNSVGGVGIGLALTRELLKLHHGSVTLESTVGNGSVFSVFLPLDPQVYSNEELSEAKPFLATSFSDVSTSTLDRSLNESGKTGPQLNEEPDGSDIPQILVVDDNADMRLYISGVLSEFYSISEAGHGDQGFEIACNTIPDLIITDVMMHPVNGIEFCRKLKQDERTSHIPVIMLTSLSDARDRIQGLETGADDYVTKPFSTQEMLVRIRNLILQRKKLRELFSSTINLEPKAISITSADEKFLRKLIQIIEDNIDNSELDLEFLLKNIAMSRSQLHRKITALTGQPITGFIRIIRIKRAAQLFEQKFGNVSDVMYAVGFNNLSYFTKSFREVYNMTPSEFMAK